MSSDSLEELDRLVFSLIDRQLSEAEVARLDTLLSESPETVIRYHELLDNHEALRDLLGRCLPFLARSKRIPLDADVTPIANSTSRVWRRVGAGGGRGGDRCRALRAES